MPTMDEEHCVIAIQRPQIKRCYNVFFDMFAVCLNASETTAGQRVAPPLPVAASAERHCKDTKTFVLQQKNEYPTRTES